ncbi:LOW QUALITY PROTEIN: hypothetical protein OSB04_005661 [Centaurea solstitialis]|uniref:Bulb-type lectin domain-containing protein n=1 Tax=Centaurea solstitialis TaxID=347529 RepID=A0AA38TS19_9ASTR|nr:LOW QUALITY PROTEIN: hypothetical protein OSB04_005661 [Centaurea solstitialis]
MHSDELRPVKHMCTPTKSRSLWRNTCALRRTPFGETHQHSNKTYVHTTKHLCTTTTTASSSSSTIASAFVLPLDPFSIGFTPTRAAMEDAATRASMKDAAMRAPMKDATEQICWWWWWWKASNPVVVVVEGGDYGGSDCGGGGCLSQFFSFLVLSSSSFSYIPTRLFCNPMIIILQIFPTHGQLAPYSLHFQPIGITIRTFLLGATYGPKFACGIVCTAECTSYHFAVFIFNTYNSDFVRLLSFGKPIEIITSGATLNLTVASKLVLRDIDVSTVWTINNIEKFAVRVSLTYDRNLMLLDADGNVVWRSFDYQPHILLLGQKVFSRTQIDTSCVVNQLDCTKRYQNFQVDNKGWFVAVEANPQQRESYDIVTGNENSHARFLNDSLSFFGVSTEPTDPQFLTSILQALVVQFMKLMQNE